MGSIVWLQGINIIINAFIDLDAPQRPYYIISFNILENEPG